MGLNVLISQRHTVNQHGDWIDSLENNYPIFFKRFGINLIPVSNTVDSILEFASSFNIAGIILTGGGDVNPELYGDSIDENLIISPKRDQTEFRLIEFGIANNLPILGICRGMQIINVFFGGRLISKISLIDPRNVHGRPGDRHHIKVIEENLLSAVGEPSIDVNSYHNQGILKEMLGKDLTPFAIIESLDLIEGFFHNRYPIAGVVWHPEREKLSSQLDSILTSAFINRGLYWDNKAIK